MIFKDPSAWQTAKRVFREHRKIIVRMTPIFVLLAVLSSAATAGKAYIMKPMLDDVFQNPDRAQVMEFALLAAAIFLGASLLQLGSGLFMGFFRSKMVAAVRRRLVASLLKADLDFYHYRQSGDILSRLSGDTGGLVNAITSIFGLMQNICIMTALVGLLFYQSPPLGLIATVLGTITVPAVLYLGRRKRDISRRLREVEGGFLASSEEMIRGIACVKSFTRENHEKSLLGKIINKVANRELQTAGINGALAGVGQSLQGLAILVFVIVGAALMEKQVITLGVFFLAFATLLLAYRHFQSLIGGYSALQAGIPTAERIYQVVDEKPTVVNPPEPLSGELLDGRQPLHIRVEDINFRYVSKRGGSNPVLFENISLDISPGKTTALVGHSGSGKSTMVKLILRFMDVGGGKITVNSHDIRDFKIKDLRSKLALVSQDTFLFGDTIINNILYGRPGTSVRQAKEVCRRIGIEEAFINRLSDGYHTYIGPGGVMLSGGQCQLVSIARAMLKDSPILLLDEATASIDAKLESVVHKAIRTLSVGRTVVIIAHRLSTVKDSNMIYVLDRGRIIENGTHAELLAIPGFYNEMVKLQLLDPGKAA